jgi:DNA topoisomerase VI subunit A
VRSLANVKYDVKRGHFEILGKMATRTLSYNTVKTFAQSMRLLATTKNDLLDKDDIAGKREVYYNSKSWGECRFDEQPESDTLLDDMEAMLGINREQLGYIPEERGGDVCGPLVVIDRDPRAGGHQDRLREAGQRRVEHPVARGAPALRDEGEICAGGRDGLAVPAPGAPPLLREGQLRADLDERRADARLPAVHPAAGGRPEAAGAGVHRRRPVRLLQHLPHAEGGLRAGGAHQPFFCVPQAHYLGVTPQDIIDYNLEDATHPLEEADIKRAKDALKNDPFIKHHKEWQAR